MKRLISLLLLAFSLFAAPAFAADVNFLVRDLHVQERLGRAAKVAYMEKHLLLRAGAQNKTKAALGLPAHHAALLLRHV